MTTHVTPHRSLGMPWMPLNRALTAKSKRSVGFLSRAGESVVSRLDCACCSDLASVPPYGANMALYLNPAFFLLPAKHIYPSMENWPHHKQTCTS